MKKAQLAIGDREIFTNEEGERVSRLKEVNSDWIIRRLERWGRKVRISQTTQRSKHESRQPNFGYTFEARMLMIKLPLRIIVILVLGACSVIM